jgi:hypothetical protein
MPTKIGNSPDKMINNHVCFLLINSLSYTCSKESASFMTNNYQLTVAKRI